jgi:transcriptional regulator with XRE-family HTH domain
MQASLAERVEVDTETISRFERGAALPSLLTLEKLSKCMRMGVGELLAESSGRPDDLAAQVSARLAGLSEDNRQFVMELAKRACKHLRR